MTAEWDLCLFSGVGKKRFWPHFLLRKQFACWPEKAAKNSTKFLTLFPENVAYFCGIFPKVKPDRTSEFLRKVHPKLWLRSLMSKGLLLQVGSTFQITFRTLWAIDFLLVIFPSSYKVCFYLSIKRKGDIWFEERRANKKKNRLIAQPISALER